MLSHPFLSFFFNSADILEVKLQLMQIVLMRNVIHVIFTLFICCGSDLTLGILHFNLNHIVFCISFPLTNAENNVLS